MTTNCLPVLKSVHLNCGQHLGNVHEGLVGNSTQSGISMLGQVSILIVCVSISQVIAAQMPLGRYSLFGNMARLVILSKHLPGCAKNRNKEKEMIISKVEINKGRKFSSVFKNYAYLMDKMYSSLLFLFNYLTKTKDLGHELFLK